jgi:protein XagA
MFQNIQNQCTQIQHTQDRALIKLASTIMAICSIGFSSVTLAGAWVGKEGTGYGKLGYAVYNSSDYFGEISNFDNFKGVNTSFYAERGVGNNFAIYGTLLYQQLQQTDGNNFTRDAKGFGDTEVGTKYQWWADPFVLSTSFLVKLPFLYHVKEGFPLGNGYEDYETKVLIGKGLNAYGYFGLELGYRLRTGPATDQYRYLLEYGFNINKHLYLRTKLDGILSAKKSDTSKLTDANGVNLSASPDYDLGKLELTAGWSFDKDESDRQWGLELSYTPDIYGDNTLKGNSIQFGLTRVY